MRIKKQISKEVSSLCAEIGPGDGVRPGRKRDHELSENPERKIGQVCRLVEKTVQMALSSGDERLADLQIVRVEPAPDSRRLRILVITTQTVSDNTHIVTAINQAKGWIRSEIATVLNRKRVPEISFQLLQDCPGEYDAC